MSLSFLSNITWGLCKYIFPQWQKISTWWCKHKRTLKKTRQNVAQWCAQLKCWSNFGRNTVLTISWRRWSTSEHGLTAAPQKENYVSETSDSDLRSGWLPSLQTLSLQVRADQEPLTYSGGSAASHAPPLLFTTASRACKYLGQRFLNSTWVRAAAAVPIGFSLV